MSDLRRMARPTDPHDGRHDKPVAAIVSTEDLRRLEALENAEDVADAAAALKEARAKGTSPLEVVLRKHGLDHLLVDGPSSPRRIASPKRGRKMRRG